METKRKSKRPALSTVLAYGTFAIASLLFVSGCANKSSLERQVGSACEGFVDEAISTFNNLGWIGAQSHPLNRSLSFPNPDDEESTISPGGLVVTKVFEDSVAAKAKLSEGHVIVGVGNEWLPIKDDPTVDFIKLIEANVAGDQKTSELRVYDGQSLRTVVIQNVATSLEPAIDNSVARYQDAHLKGLRYLAGRQHDDGSFGSTDDFDQTLQTTCIAALSFLTATDEQFKPNVDKCLEFVASQLDQKSSAPRDGKETESAKATRDATPGIVMMSMPEIDLDPLTAAYVLQLYAESELQMIDQAWMPRIMGTIGSLSKSQSETGAWNQESAATDNDETGDEAWATFTTNQVLLGIGMLERKGMMGNPETIRKACEYLKNASEARSAIGMDRRLKSSLTSGTAAALFAVNCKAADVFFKQAIEDGLSRPGECHTSPRLTLSGALSTAILARQTGPEAWEQFHAETRYWLSSMQLPDGSFQFTPLNQSGLDAEEASSSNDPDWQSALYCILLSMPSDSLPKMKAELKSPMMVVRTSDGKEVEGSKTAAAPTIPGVPAGAKVMSFSMDDLSGEGSLEDQIKEKLKSMGIEGDINIGSPSGSSTDEDQ